MDYRALPFFILCLSVILTVSVTTEASDVKVLTPENFDDLVGKEEEAFVEFYAPWCGHCKKLAPEYEKVAEAFKNKHTVIGKVDCDEHKDLCGRFGVTSYPTLKYFPKNSLVPEPYDGGRTAEEIVDFVNQKSGTSASIPSPPSNVLVVTSKNIEKIISEKEKFVLLEFYAPWCGHCKSLAPIYEKLANAFKYEKNVIIAKCDADAHKDIGSRFGVEGFPTIKYFLPGSTKDEKYDGARTLDSLIDFVNENAKTFRMENGNLNKEAGKVSELDELAEEFVRAKEGERESVIGKILEAVKASESKTASLYEKVVAGIKEKGADYLKRENDRLQNLISGKVSRSKAEHLTIRRNIISSFLPKVEERDEFGIPKNPKMMRVSL